MAKKNVVDLDSDVKDKKAEAETPAPQADANTILAELIANAISKGVAATRPKEKKNVFNRKKNTPWTPKDGETKLTLKAKLHQHNIEIPVDRLSNKQIELANKLRPGRYGNGHFNVIRRRDRGINIEYPIRSVSQRLQLISKFGIRNFTELLEYLVAEGAKRPKAVEYDEAD